jgi:hypothetical protein
VKIFSRVVEAGQEVEPEGERQPDEQNMPGEALCPLALRRNRVGGREQQQERHERTPVEQAPRERQPVASGEQTYAENPVPHREKREGPEEDENPGRDRQGRQAGVILCRVSGRIESDCYRPRVLHGRGAALLEAPSQTSDRRTGPR